MILGSELVLGCFAIGFGVALAQQFREAKPQSSIAVFAQLTLLVMIGAVVSLMIALARNPMLTFSPKVVSTS